MIKLWVVNRFHIITKCISGQKGILVIALNVEKSMLASFLFLFESHNLIKIPTLSFFGTNRNLPAYPRAPRGIGEVRDLLHALLALRPAFQPSARRVSRHEENDGRDSRSSSDPYREGVEQAEIPPREPHDQGHSPSLSDPPWHTVFRHVSMILLTFPTRKSSVLLECCT